MSGFIKLHRKLLEWQWQDDVPVFCLFIKLLLKANFKESNYRGISLKRGEILTGRFELAKSTGLSEQQVRTALSKLKSTNEITIKSTKHYSIISLTNYNLYQDKSEEINQPINQEVNQQSTNNQPTINQQSTTNKKSKEEEECKEEKEKYFNQFWESYIPVKTKEGKKIDKGSKKETLKSFERALKKHDFETIMRGLEIYLKRCQANNTFTCGASVFLNQERFIFEEEVFIDAMPSLNRQQKNDQALINFLNNG